MNSQTANRASGAAIGFIVASAFFAFMVVGIKLHLPTTSIDADRAAERSKALNEIHTNENNALERAGWADQSRGLVRLPIETAMQLTAQKWQNPSNARAELSGRAEKAAAPAPAAPPKPSAFE